jgi:two-component sensor histidine kinase
MEKWLAFLPERPQPPLVRYGATLLIISVCCLVQLGIFRIAGVTSFFVLIPGVFASGILFDRGSGFLATGVGVLFATFLSPPELTALEQAVPDLLFAIIGVGTAIVSESLRKIMERLAREQRATDLLLRELDHRAKNNMTKMTSILHMQARTSANSEARAALHAAAGRVQVMANIHNHLKPTSPDRSINMRQYLEDLCSKIDELSVVTAATISLTADDTILPEHKALPLAFIANELVTNSLKYAFIDGRSGHIDVDLKTDGEIVLAVRDDGVGRDANAKPGVGAKLVDVMTTELRGSVTYEDANPGCRVTVRIPAQ